MYGRREIDKEGKMREKVNLGQQSGQDELIRSLI